MRIKTIEQKIALKQLKGTPIPMAVQHIRSDNDKFSKMYMVKMSLIVGYDIIKHKSSCIV